MTKYGYMAVEGPHDVAFVARLLTPFGFHRVQKKVHLDAGWHYLVPDTFPYQDDLLMRVPVPLFLQNATHSVAIHGASGETNLVEMVQETLATTDPKQMRHLVGVGLILDADKQFSATERFASVSQKMAALHIPLALPASAGIVTSNSPRCGVFVLPDNASSGTLADILLACAEVIYPDLLTDAKAFVAGVDLTRLSHADQRDLGRPAGKNKAVVSSIASILKPGRSIQVSIQDNRWLENAALALPPVKAVQAFLAELLELP